MPLVSAAYEKKTMLELTNVRPLQQDATHFCKFSLKIIDIERGYEINPKYPLRLLCVDRYGLRINVKAFDQNIEPKIVALQL
uniref:MSP domain-containing protein n=1 Tax=Steinernema glaseri TaxID=37863 RepID=A0A1I7Y098_9BILA